MSYINIQDALKAIQSKTIKDQSVPLPPKDASRSDIRKYYNALSESARTQVTNLLTDYPQPRQEGEPLDHFIWRKNLQHKFISEWAIQYREAKVRQAIADTLETREATRILPNKPKKGNL